MLLQILAALLAALVVLQTDTPAVPITADNVTQLAPVTWIDFDSVRGDIPVERGWFTMSPDGGTIAAVRRDGGLALWSAQGEPLATFTVMQEEIETAVIDARFDSSGQRIASLHTADGQRYIVAIYTLSGEQITFRYPDEMGMPVRVWFDADDEHILWVETQPDPYQTPAGDHAVVRLSIALTEDPLFIIPSAPEKDTSAIVRIGRIPAPLAITATQEGLVRLWDLQTGEPRAEVQLEDVPVFGRIVETTGRYFAWRDQTSQALHLLDFESGEDRLIAEIGGEYIQAMMIVPDASVILGVHMGSDPSVIAWRTDSGDMVSLGAYRAECSGVPDMVTLSEDGARLIIGCDAGIEVWQIVQ